MALSQSVAPCVLPPPLLPLWNIGVFSPFPMLPTYSSSFIHEYFNVHQNNGIASTYIVSKAKDSLCYLHCITEKISHQKRSSKSFNGEQQNAIWAGFLACVSAWSLSPERWDSVPHCGHYWQIPAGGYLAFCSEVSKCFRAFANLLNWNFCCLCPIRHVVTVCLYM
jgi:hypothetical protein